MRQEQATFILVATTEDMEGMSLILLSQSLRSVTKTRLLAVM